MTEPLTDQPEPGSLHVEHLDEMSAQQCPAGKHADWAVNSEHAHACPWCEIARLRADLASYQAESAQYDRDHERLSAELEQARAKILAVEQARCWTNEDGRRFVFADDLLAAVQLAAPAEPPRPSPNHMAVYVDQHNSGAWVDYPTVPPGDDVVPLVTASEETSSRAGLADDGVELRVVGWIK